MFLLKIRTPPKSTRTNTLCPYATHFRTQGLPCPQRDGEERSEEGRRRVRRHLHPLARPRRLCGPRQAVRRGRRRLGQRPGHRDPGPPRSGEHTSELQSLMRISYAVFCLIKKKQITNPLHTSLFLFI